MNKTIEYSTDKEIELAINKVLNVVIYFEEKYLTYDIIINILYNNYKYKKWFIDVIIKSLFLILNEAFKQKLVIRIYRFGIFEVKEFIDGKEVIFTPHHELIYSINNKVKIGKKFDYLYVNKNKDKIKIVDMTKQKNRYKSTSLANFEPNIRKFSIKNKEKINLDIIKNNEISIMDIVKLINTRLKNYKFNRYYTSELVKDFFTIIKEAIIIGIDVDLDKFGLFFPIEKKDKRIKFLKTKFYFYVNGILKPKEILGFASVGFRSYIFRDENNIN